MGAENWAIFFATRKMCHVWDELTLPVLDDPEISCDLSGQIFSWKLSSLVR